MESSIMPSHRDQTADATDVLTEYWLDVRPKALPRQMPARGSPLKIHPFVRWASRLVEPRHEALYVVPGPTQQDRQFLYEQYFKPKFEPFRVGAVDDLSGSHVRDWLTQGPLQNFSQRISKLRIPDDCLDKRMAEALTDQVTWEILWGLVLQTDFLVSQPLRALVDKSSTLVHSAYKAIWAARFSYQEKGAGRQLLDILDSTLQWLSGMHLNRQQTTLLAEIGVQGRVESDKEKLDMLMFLLAMAYQNGLFSRVVFAFDGLEKGLTSSYLEAIQQLGLLVSRAEHWSKYETPVGIIIGMDTSGNTLESLGQMNPRLALRIRKRLEAQGESV